MTEHQATRKAQELNDRKVPGAKATPHQVNGGDYWIVLCDYTVPHSGEVCETIQIHNYRPTKNR